MPLKENATAPETAQPSAASQTQQMRDIHIEGTGNTIVIQQTVAGRRGNGELIHAAINFDSSSRARETRGGGEAHEALPREGARESAPCIRAESASGFHAARLPSFQGRKAFLLVLLAAGSVLALIGSLIVYRGSNASSARRIESLRRSCSLGEHGACRSLFVTYERLCQVEQNPEDCVTLGSMHASGQGTDKDEAVAAKYYKIGCDKKIAPGCFMLGYLYDEGKIGKIDKQKAYFYYEIACNMKQETACSNLAILAAENKESPEKVRQLYRTACDLDSVHGCVNLALMLKSGKGGATDLPEAAALLRSACEKREHGDACLFLAQTFKENPAGGAATESYARYVSMGCRFGSLEACYIQHAHNLRLNNDLDTALNLESGCKKGHAKSCFAAADFYERKLDLPRAISLFKGACDQRLWLGCTRLGTAYEKSNILNKKALAMSAYRASCEHNESSGCYNLSLQLLEETEQPESVKEAVRRLTGACDRGHTKSCAKMGTLLAGQLLAASAADEKKASEALRFLDVACRAQQGTACYNLAKIYERGKLVSANSEKAQKYYQSACQAGEPDSCKLIK